MLGRTRSLFASSLWLPTKKATINAYSFSSMERFSKKLKAKKNFLEEEEINIDSTENEQKEQNQPKQEKSKSFIPPNFVVKHLLWPATNSSVLLLGVDRRDALHGSFLQGIFVRNSLYLC